MSYSVEKEDTALSLLENGDVSAVVILPEKFVFDMKMNMMTPFRNKIDIKILTHPDRNIDGQIVKAVVDAYKNVMSSVIIGKNVVIESAMSNNLGDDALSGISDAALLMEESLENINIDLNDVTVKGRKNITSTDYYAAAMICMFILYAASHGGRMLLEEKENITLQRMIVAGVSKYKILAGKYFTIFLIAVIQIAVMIIFSHFALKVQWGNIFLVCLISLIAAFAVSGIGAFIATATYKSNNYKMANIFETAVIQGMALIGGCFIPVDAFPEIIKKLSMFSVNGFALKAYLKVMIGYSFNDIKNFILILSAIGIVFLVLAVIILKEREADKNAEYNKTEAVEA